MASIYKTKSGRFVIQFPKLVGARRATVSLGKVPNSAAQTVKYRIECLIAAKIMNHPPDPETARWITGLAPQMRKKLAAVEAATWPSESESERRY